MRRDDPTRQGRAADALIASYLRELLADDEPAVAPAVREVDVTPVPLTAPTTAAAAATDATV